MTDRELLELAAKAASVRILHWNAGEAYHEKGGWPFPQKWNPLTDDGDAFRLAVKLGMTTGIEYGRKYAHCSGIKEPITDNECASMRRAIVHAAAQIGNAMP